MPPSANSAGSLLQLFRTGRARTRNDVQNLTGLARSTVTIKVDALLAAHYLVEDGSIVDGRGRPATRLRVNDQATTVLVADLGATHGRLAVSTAGGQVLSETVIESAIDTGPSAVLATVVGELEKLLAESGRDPTTVRGVGLGVPGPVDWQTGRIARSISMPGWDDYPVRDHLREHFGVLAVVDNDANLLGLGEQQRIYPSAHLLIFVKVGTGVGSSVVIDGTLLRGSDSAEGDIGHAKIPGVTETCSSCGAQGCLAAIASGRAMVRDLHRLGHPAVTTRDVVDLVRVGNPDAARVVTAAGRALGDVLSTAVSLLNPDVVVIGGDIAHAHEHFLLGVRDTLLSRSQPLATAHLRIAPSQLGDRAGITGAAAMVADEVFGRAAVDSAVP
ncbi:MAG TPA: ROK family protein [Propionibacteriaceae bacterium]|nr:ROK family protein [Propionibacteriaceae bacterium]